MGGQVAAQAFPKKSTSSVESSQSWGKHLTDEFIQPVTRISESPDAQFTDVLCPGREVSAAPALGSDRSHMRRWLWVVSEGG